MSKVDTIAALREKNALTQAQIADLRSLAINERDFLRFVRDAAHLGYGRMMQIVAREYYRAAVEDGLCPPSGVLVDGTCLGLLSKRKQEEFVSGYRCDPLFRNTR